MVAYSFQRQFVAPTLARTKVGTIRALRAPPSRHARPGETIQHYTGLRTKHVTLIGRSTCQKTRLIILSTREGYIHDPSTTETIRGDADLDAFAIGDGFQSWDKLCEFWDTVHPSIATFQGAHIIWGDSFVPVTAA